MRRPAPLFQWIAIHAFGAALLFLAWVGGLLGQVFATDQTHFVALIAIVFLIGAAIAGVKTVDLSNRLKSARLGCFDSVFKNPKALRIKLSSELTVLRFFSSALVMLGLLGTVVGFRDSIAAVNLKALTTPSLLPDMMNQFFDGMHLLLYSTGAGILGYLWMMASYTILHRTVAEIIAHTVEGTDGG